MKKKIELKTYNVVEKITVVTSDTHKILAESAEKALEMVEGIRGKYCYDEGRSYKDVNKTFEYEVVDEK